MKKILLISAGTVSVAMGIIGVFVPILPTTPFLLFSAWCYAKSSEKFYNKLMDNKILGGYIKNYRDKKAMPRRVKILTISLLWISILYSAIFAVSNIWLSLLLVIIAVLVSLHLISLRTIKDQK